jgi:uncharacterized protein (TIGR00304 family)
MGSWLHLLKSLFHLRLSAGVKTLNLAVFYALGIALLVVGIIVIIAAIIIASSKDGSTKKGKIRGAGVIMIGPIPIIFGTDKKSVKAVLALALAFTIVVLIIIIVNYWLLR